MRKRGFFFVIFTFFAAAACGNSSSPAPVPMPGVQPPAVGAPPGAVPAPVAAPVPAPPAQPALRSGGHFVAWIQHQKGIFRSNDGRTWTRVPGESTIPYSWAPWLAADARGTLYTASISDKGEVHTSSDGIAWTAVEPATAATDRMSWALCAGSAGELFAITSIGRTFHSTDGGRTWTEKTRAAPEGAQGSGGGFGGSCAFSADGSKIAVQGWYFSGSVLSVSADKGATWTPVPPPEQNAEARSIAWAGDALIWGHYDKVFRTANMGQSWETATPNPLYAPGEARHGYNRWYASDGANVVVGVESPGAGTAGEANFHGGVFLSSDGGRTFQVLPLPYEGDPTPTVSDETVRVAFVPGS